MKVFLLGFMGSGKSTLGKWAAGKLDLEYVDLDRMIEEEVGMSVEEIFAEEGEERFRQMERYALGSLIQETDDLLVSCGGGTPCFFDNMKKMNEAGLTIYLDLSPERLAGRLRQSQTVRPLLADAGERLTQRIEDLLTPRLAFYRQARVILDEPFATRKGLLEVLENYLNESQA